MHSFIHTDGLFFSSSLFKGTAIFEVFFNKLSIIPHQTQERSDLGYTKEVAFLEYLIVIEDLAVTPLLTLSV